MDRLSRWMKPRAGVALLSISILVGCSTTGRDAFPVLAKHAPGILLDDQSRAILPAGVALRPVVPEGLELTKLSEGWVPRLYNDAAGYCTIGYGHLIKKARCNGTEPVEFRGGITKTRGTELLRSDMRDAQIVVMTAVNASMTDAQFAAIVDFVFNVGASNFRTSTLLRRLNARQFDQVPTQLRRWVLADGKKFPGLVTRREREIVLFFKGQPVPKDVPAGDEDISSLDIRRGEPGK